MAMTLAQKTDMYRFFAIAFDAAPGVTYMDQLDTALAGGMTTQQVVNVFTTKSVFTAMYPNFLDNTTFATKLVNNVVGSSASDAAKAEAVNDIVGALNIAGTTRGDVIYTVFNNLANKPYSDATWGNTAKQLANQVAVAQYYTETLLGNATDTATLQSVIAAVTNLSDVSTPAAISALIGAAGGQTFTLTTGIDAIVGGLGNDTVNSLVSGGLSALDSVDGGAGTNVLNVTDTASFNVPASATVKNFQTANLVSGGTIGATNGDVSAWAGLTQLNASTYGGASLIAAATTSVTETDTLLAAGNVVIAGGKNVTVNGSSATSTGSINVGVAVDHTTATTAPAGAVTVTNAGTGGVYVKGGTTQNVTNAGLVTLSKASGDVSVTTTKTGAVTVDDGANVTVTAAATGTANIVVGNSGVASPAVGTPTGVVTIVNNLSNAAAAATNITGGSVTVTGGTSVSVTQTASQAVMATASTNSTITQGTVTVNGGAATTAVAVKDAPTVAAANTVLAVAAVTETDTVTFGALKSGDVLTIDGLVFTAAQNLTAAQVASAFANLSATAVQGSAAAALGTYSGAFAGNWTTGAASSGAVVFTTTGTGDVAAPSISLTNTSGNSVIATAAETVKGVSKATAAGTGGVTAGAMNVADVNANSATKAGVIATVTLDGYGAASSVASNALSTLSLANSTGQTVTVVNNNGVGVTTLDLTVNKLGAASALDLENSATAANKTYKTLNVHTTGADSVLNVTGSVLTALTVDGTKAVNLTGSTLTALKTVVVSGSAGVTAATAFTGASVTDVNASATSGAMSATIASGQTTYEGGSGVDTITLTGTTPSKAISLGAGNDVLTLAAATTNVTAILDGGTGTDTLSMSVASENNLEAVTGIQSNIVGFEVLDLTSAVTGTAVDVSKLGFTSITVEGLADSGSHTNALTLNSFGNGSTLTINANTAATLTTGGYVLANTAFTAGTADVVNVVLGKTVTAAGNLTAANVETVNITANNTAAATETLVATSAKAITVGGAGALTLTSASNAAVTTFDASSNSGGVTYSSGSTVAETITGGSGNDVLTANAASTKAVVINGGAGNDTITANAYMDTLTGGAGNDTFVITVAPVNVNSYSTITDASAGDKILMTGALTFAAAKLSLGDTAVFQDYANLAISSTNTNDVTWFQFGGNTYVVENISNDATAFQNGGVSGDMIVKLTGLVDLSTASFSSAVHTIQL